MKSEQFRNMTEAELEDKIRSLREELFNLRFRLVTQRLENPLRLRLLKRDVARAMTALRERELSQVRGGGRAKASAPSAGSEEGGQGREPAE